MTKIHITRRLVLGEVYKLKHKDQRIFMRRKDAFYDKVCEYEGCIMNTDDYRIMIDKLIDKINKEHK